MANQARNYVITPQSLREVVAQAVRAAKARPRMPGAQVGVTGIPRNLQRDQAHPGHA